MSIALIILTIYIIQTVIVLIVSYCSLQKGDTLYDLFSLKRMEESIGLPGWVCGIPLFGTAACLMVAMMCVGYAFYDLVWKRVTKFLKRTLNIRIK